MALTATHKGIHLLVDINSLTHQERVKRRVTKNNSLKFINVRETLEEQLEIPYAKELLRCDNPASKFLDDFFKYNKNLDII